MYCDTFYQVKGAYGRSYKRLADAQIDWDENLDFTMIQGPGTYVNKSDHERFGGIRQVKIGLGGGLWGNLT